MGVFEKLLGLGSLECPKTLLVHQQVALLISNGGHKVDFFEGHCSSCLFGNWALVAPMIISKFLLDYHMFLLEVIGVNSSKSFCRHI